MGVKSKLKKTIPKGAYSPFLPSYHWSRAMVANVRYGSPAKKMHVIGVTGTNGKTTTVNMIGSILEAAGHKVGVLSSAVVQIGEDWQDSELTLTTEDVFVLQKYLKKMRDAGVTHIVLEVSSHAIAQSRILRIPFEGAVFTNLTQDHLDYHGSMDKYAKTKLKLLKRAKDFVVLNGDDSWFEFFNVRKSDMASVYGTTDKADIRVTSAKITNHSAQAHLETSQGPLDIKLNLTGKFNVYNAMAAVGVAQKLGIPDMKIKEGLINLTHVPGRMEPIDEGQDFSAMVDHAHTADSLENLLRNLRRTTEKELIVIAGADGERDPSKRVPIGRVISKYADKIYVTDQEPYGDEPGPIRKEVIRGIQTRGFTDFEEIPDRRHAITSAMKRASKGDMVVVTGMGNQKYRGMAEGKIKWDDRSVVREELVRIGAKIPEPPKERGVDVEQVPTKEPIKPPKKDSKKFKSRKVKKKVKPKKTKK